VKGAPISCRLERVELVNLALCHNVCGVRLFGTSVAEWSEARRHSQCRAGLAIFARCSVNRNKEIPMFEMIGYLASAAIGFIAGMMTYRRMLKRDPDALEDLAKEIKRRSP